MWAAVLASRVVRFDIFELDVRAGELRKAGVKLRQQGQPIQVKIATPKMSRDGLKRTVVRRDRLLISRYRLHANNRPQESVLVDVDREIGKSWENRRPESRALRVSIYGSSPLQKESLRSSVAPEHDRKFVSLRGFKLSHVFSEYVRFDRSNCSKGVVPPPHPSPGPRWILPTAKSHHRIRFSLRLRNDRCELNGPSPLIKSSLGLRQCSAEGSPVGGGAWSTAAGGPSNSASPGSSASAQT